jgi:hypothetical protein
MKMSRRKEYSIGVKAPTGTDHGKLLNLPMGLVE